MSSPKAFVCNNNNNNKQTFQNTQQTNCHKGARGNYTGTVCLKLWTTAPQIQLWCWHCAPYKCSYYYYTVDSFKANLS